MFQILTGLMITFNYSPMGREAFDSVIRLLFEVNYGWFYRYYHAQGVSFCFLLLFLHLLKGLWYSSKHLPWSWYSGIVILVLTMGVAFLGYVLPYGQMSYWGATVITNLFYWAQDFVTVLLGGFSVCTETLKRFYILHFVLPFVILAIVVVHIYFLHRSASTNPLSCVDAYLVVRFFPTIIFSDLKMLVVVSIILSLHLTYGVIPLFQGDCDNSIVADPLQTPLHIVPEWYLLVFYATLKLLPSKLSGLIAMGLLMESLVLLVESRSVSPIISCTYYHRMWTLSTISIVPALFMLGSLGRMVINDGLFVIGICLVVIILISVYKSLDNANIRIA